MQKLWRRRLGWVVVSVLAGCLYAACAWLWAAPYRVKPAAFVPRAAAVAIAPVAPKTIVSGPASSEIRRAEPPPILVKRVRTPSLENTRNLLLIGLDRRPDGSGPALADSLVVLVLDDATGHIGLVSIPRDLLVDIPGGASDRINTVYQVARRTARDPLTLMSRVVEDTLKLPIEHAIALDLGVFERAVDAVGGVDVDVPCL
jgi:anionic cell wall polymer biosynthesis LytR-Cps2A-Psr (LCP) family protein